MRARLPLLLALAVAACAGPPPPAPRPAPRVPLPIPRPAPPPALGADWRDWPLTPGTWAYRRDARGSIALFGSPNGDAAVTLRCDLGRRQLFLSRAGGAAAPLTIRTSSTTRTLQALPVGGDGLPYIAAALAPSDQLLDAMAFSRGRFVIEQPHSPPLVIPAWAEIGRVTEDCRG